jgi:hypothetical protein
MEELGVVVEQTGEPVLHMVDHIVVQSSSALADQPVRILLVDDDLAPSMAAVHRLRCSVNGHGMSMGHLQLDSQHEHILPRPRRRNRHWLSHLFFSSEHHVECVLDNLVPPLFCLGKYSRQVLGTSWH